ncbi:class I SAM-dependent methyltransferase [Fibrobacter sp. UBA3718]|uniref:class I SAM-dependent methyltransferase n=1 Tax=Fibrobacter sp. UBA3718 TaxID=1946531 RepID=UPI0025C69628|nr:class I SAM-dependent methyltransferase [Fibrobacter sp. UBA3718]
MQPWNLLASDTVQGFIEEALTRKLDALQVSTALNKQGYSNEERAAIMDYMALVPKFREKFANNETARGMFLLCDKLALEQSTAQDIGRWKAKLWPCGNDATSDATENATGTGAEVHDLCCGMGGDSFYLPAGLKVTGVDLDENRLAMYSHNMQAFGKNAETICADVRSVEGADYFTIDPARRAIEGENQRDLKNLTPTLEEVVEISKHYKGGMAKLPPGYPPAEIPDGTEILYLGGHGDCRECLVLFGELAKHPDTVRAIIVGKAGETLAEWTRRRDRSLETLDDDLQEKLDRNDSLEGKDRTYRTATSRSDLPLGEIGKYIAEPAPVLIRSRIFNEAALAHDPNAHLISEGIAYVSSDKPLPAPGFSCYEVLAHTEIATGAVRSMLKEHDIGKITLKLRGVKLDPDAETKRLKPKGKNSAILFYTRFRGEKTAILTRRCPPSRA